MRFLSLLCIIIFCGISPTQNQILAAVAQAEDEGRKMPSQESAASNVVSLQPQASSAAPGIAVLSENASQIGLYEKYELVLSLTDASFNNPFDPEEIDVQALFTAPSGRQWLIYAFYDNYSNRQQWKVRFAPNEVGVWTYHLTARDVHGLGRSIDYSFQAVPSAHHGWLHVSQANPHYFIHDDGASFYGVAVYWPWRITNNAAGLGALQQAGCNFIGFWNVTYDDGTLIESMTSGLGRYDQNKCNRIDTIIQWMEQRDMVLMLAIWPHDLFCLNMPGWAALWNQNPYKQLCSVVEIYENETAWRYQEKQYRYLIARWGYSRGLGLWEIMNEINGTDAWPAGRIPQAENWTRKVHDFLTRHDPFGRPTTASMSGGQYWKNGYAIFDVPNVHMYETGWAPQYNNNPLRSSLWTYRNVTRQLWDDFAKPAIMGEAGWLNSYGDFAGDSEEYAIMYHNALWSSWASGQASTPVWWAYDARVMGPKVMQRLQRFSAFAPQVEVAHHPFAPVEAGVADADAFAMGTHNLAFGWTRDAWGGDISGRILRLKGLRDSVYVVEWYDPWQGVLVTRNSRPSLGGELIDELPSLKDRTPDLAFIIRPAETGTQPAKLALFAQPRQLYSDGLSTAEIQCLIFDGQDRFCYKANNTLSFQLTGPAHLTGPATVAAKNGLASITVRSDSSGNGMATFIVSSPGLIPDTVSIYITDIQQVDDFEVYGPRNSLDLFWKPISGTYAAAILEKTLIASGAQGLRMDYAIGNGKPPFAGVGCTLPPGFLDAQYLRFWLRGDGSQRQLVIKLNKTSSIFWQYPLYLRSGEGEWVEVPLDLFAPSGSPEPLDLQQVNHLSFNVLPGDGGMGVGTIYFDEIIFSNSPMTDVTMPAGEDLPESFTLSQNYPNPFNSATEFNYVLPLSGEVDFSIYNLAGQEVERLVQSWQAAGQYRVQWQAEGLSSGVYWGVLRAGEEIRTTKCLLLR